MEPDAYGGLLNSALPQSALSAPPSSVPSTLSSHSVNYETRSSSRRNHHQKKRRNEGSSAPATSTDSQDERIEVKILPQDDNWGETTTTTCNGGNEDTLTNNNDTSLQLDTNRHHTNHFQHLSNNLNRRRSFLSISQFGIYLLCLIAFISPIFFLTLPYTLITSELISIDDYSPLLTIIFKLIFLLLGTFLLLYRRRNTTYLPCMQLQKMALMVILLIIILVYWFYYIFKLLQPKIDKYDRILSMTSTYEDLLLFLFILSVIILEVKWLYPKWIVKVVRSPDGETRHYTIGKTDCLER
jgi:vang-like